MTDLVLAILHHGLVFGLVAMLATERAMLASETVDARRLTRLDAGYGAAAGLVLIVGVARVVTGGKGWAFYETNPFFWAKLATFAAIGLASIPPTLQFRRWTRAGGEVAFAPDANARRRARAWTGWQLLGFLPLVGFAAAMARWPF